MSYSLQKPLTDREIEDLVIEEEFLLYYNQDELTQIIKAVERRHGIK